MSAFNEGDRIVVDVCQQDVPLFPFADGSLTDHRRATQLLTAGSSIGGKPGSFAVERPSDERCEYPRIDERRTGLSYQHGYVACNGEPGSDDIFHRGIGGRSGHQKAIGPYPETPRFATTG